MNRPFTLVATAQERVHFGASVRDALGAEVDRLGARRVFIAASRTLRRETGAISLIAGALGPRCVAIFDGITEHAGMASVMAALDEARRSRADLLVSCGGGSIIDALKIVQLGLAWNATSTEALRAAATSTMAPPNPWTRQVAIPTTLSGAETTPAGGGTDETRGVKMGFSARMLVPVSVIYDPAIGALTPEWLWLSSALRGIDHCCEGIISRQANLHADASLLQALSLFAASLRRTRTVPGDPDARLQSQVAAHLACSGCFMTGSGASHGIGYVLGGRYGVHHGHASCTILPHVLRWNEPVTGERQDRISHALGRPGMPAGDAVAELISDLGLPARLRDVGIREDQLQAIAEECARHPVVLANPRAITSPADVRQILDAAW
ncbi:MAG: iron-containing alcohol dehydrogenase [Alphaproteobacteria bacterium]|nr:iron-containing alcohol dehydrogenase [Alphaproteobacteria bacterium]